MLINIKKKDKISVFIALYNAATPKRTIYPEPLTRDEAKKILTKNKFYVDIYNGRLLKLDLSKDKLDTFFYDIYNDLKAKEIIEALPDVVS